jgi:hypothetical protein
LDVVPDGLDVLPASPNAPTHHTIFNLDDMTADRLGELFKDLGWIYGGKK